MKVLSVACARAGSKGLKNKCIAKIDGRMTVEFSIAYSLSLGNDVKTVVSTNIDEVISFCKINGIDYIKRDSLLCKDEAKIEDALADAIKQKGQGYQYCSLVYGNIPTRYNQIFHKAKFFLEGHLNYSAVISMQNVEKFHPEWMLNYDYRILPKKKRIHYRRQCLPQRMIHDGHTLIFKIKEFCKRHEGLVKYENEYLYSIFGRKIKPLLNNEVVIDIDTEKDLKLAKAYLSRFDCKRKTCAK